MVALPPRRIALILLFGFFAATVIIYHGAVYRKLFEGERLRHVAAQAELEKQQEQEEQRQMQIEAEFDRQMEIAHSHGPPIPDTPPPPHVVVPENKPPPPPPADPIDVTILETVGFHDEVTAAMVYAFGSLPNAKLRMFLKRQRFGISEIFHSFNTTSPIVSVRPSSDFATTKKVPKILVSTSCEADAVNFPEEFNRLLDKRKTFLYCVVHRADRWHGTPNDLALQPWIREGLVDFITLSEHTAVYFHENAIADPTLRDSVVLKVLPPLFPVKIPEVEFTGVDIGVVVQGNYANPHRDYQSIFRTLSYLLSHSINKKKENPRDISLHLVGHGQHPTVPKHLESRVFFDEKLKYLPYFAMIAESTAVLPAFAGEEYLDRKSSSSIPAALIGGTPVVADRKMLEAYTYLDEDAVWIREPGESEMDVVGKLLESPPELVQRRKHMVQIQCRQILQRNVRDVNQWVDIAVRRVSG